MHIYSVFFWKFAYETFPKLERSLVFEYKGNICALLEHESLFILNSHLSFVMQDGKLSRGTSIFIFTVERLDKLVMLYG